MWQGQDSNLCRQCRRFYRSHCQLPASPVPSPPVPLDARDVHKRPIDSFRGHGSSPPVPSRLAQPHVRWREVGGKSRPSPAQSPTPIPCRVIAFWSLIQTCCLAAYLNRPMSARSAGKGLSIIVVPDITRARTTTTEACRKRTTTAGSRIQQRSSRTPASGINASGGRSPRAPGCAGEPSLCTPRDRSRPWSLCRLHRVAPGGAVAFAVAALEQRH
jgi:hypothetical protein